MGPKGVCKRERATFACGMKAPKVISPGWLSIPKCPALAERRRLSVHVEVSAQKKVRHVSDCDQKLAASCSSEFVGIGGIRSVTNGRHMEV
mgnify:CR=1 FL=1